MNDSESQAIIAQVLDEIGRDQIVEAVLSGKGGERFAKMESAIESLTRRVEVGESRWARLVGYLAAISRDADRLGNVLALLNAATEIDDDENADRLMGDPDPERQPLVKTGPGGDFTREMRACQDCSSLYTVTPAYQNEQRCWLCLEKFQQQDTIDVDRDHGGKIDLRG